MNGYFVAAEFSIIKVRGTRIEQLAIEGNRRAKHVKKVMEDLDAYLSATQLGITLASLGLGWIGEQSLATLIDGVFASMHLSATTVNVLSTILSFLLITALQIILGELVPKTLAIHRAEGMALFTAGILVGFHRVMYPAIWLLNKSASTILHLFGIRGNNQTELAHSEEELRMLVSQSHESGVIDETELSLFDNIFDFSNRVAREIMVPRTDMVCLYSTRTFQENLEVAESDKHTRFPLCETDKDHIIGVIHIKDLYAVALQGNYETSLESIARDPVTVHESMLIKDVLRILQKNRSEIAIVIDEYGGTAGMVTTEDILEELVGEIQDEFDEERPFIETKGDILSIDARLLIDEVNEYLNLNLDTEEVDTIGGWMYSQFKTPPNIGSSVAVEGYQFKVTEMDNLRVTRMEIKPVEQKNSEDSDGGGTFHGNSFVELDRENYRTV
ncbi:hemolysin family protein [Fodinisporobacter ferrooxydans]|uniref:Hemolysin family protein n=2 Tax=Fodinisporobacter ferrooxydans TaxID=2901836 RepID=A0ABY4CR60_9BACL|nr:hemolysin family protein [Alicyclobacillaceae bacterium MYW30-H2]